MQKICTSCGHENIANRTLCKHCRAPLPPTPGHQTNADPMPWYDRVLYRLVILSVIYFGGAFVVAFFRTTEEARHSGANLLVGFLIFCLYAIVMLPLTIIHVPSYQAEVWWIQILTTLALLGLPVAILLTQSRLRLIAYYIGFMFVIVFLVRACASVPIDAFPRL